MSTPGLAVTPHFLSTQAAVDVLASGGNAVDAAVAANAVQGVVAPETCGIGGDLFALIYERSGVSCLDASGWAGSGADPTGLRNDGHIRIPALHPHTVTIPGCVAGWEAILARFGSRPLSAVLSPAIELANHGFPVSEELAGSVRARAAALVAQPQGDELLIDGNLPSPGQTLRRPTLGLGLARIAEIGSDGFYRGTVARDIAQAVGGIITEDDLARYRPEWVHPISSNIFGHTAWTVPPASQGYLTLLALSVFERLEHGDDPLDESAVHALIESYRSVAWTRDEYLADRRNLDPMFEHFFFEEIEAIARSIGVGPGRYPSPRPVPEGTAYLCVVDDQGMGVSLIQSNFWGIGSGIGAAGFFLHNRGAGFDLRPGHPNELAPGKRPLHTLSPTLWTREGKLSAVLGTRGGHQQPQLIIQMAAAVFGFGLSPGDAQRLPRWTTEILGAGTGSNVSVEARMHPTTIAALRRRGHQVKEASDWEAPWGPVSMITIDDDDTRHGSADPRVPTTSAQEAILSG